MCPLLKGLQHSSVYNEYIWTFLLFSPVFVYVEHLCLWQYKGIICFFLICFICLCSVWIVTPTKTAQCPCSLKPVYHTDSDQLFVSTLLMNLKMHVNGDLISCNRSATCNDPSTNYINNGFEKKKKQTGGRVGNLITAALLIFMKWGNPCTVQRNKFAGNTSQNWVWWVNRDTNLLLEKKTAGPKRLTPSANTQINNEGEQGAAIERPHWQDRQRFGIDWWGSTSQGVHRCI